MGKCKTENIRERRAKMQPSLQCECCLKGGRPTADAQNRHTRAYLVLESTGNI